MTVGELKSLLADTPDNYAVAISIASDGMYGASVDTSEATGFETDSEQEFITLTN